MNPEVVLLDGGLGTAVDGEAQKSPLWSAAYLQHDRRQDLIDIHLRFLQAGARLIETATYQLSDETGARAGLNSAECATIMRDAVATAREACIAQANSSGVVLSLGPYGATMSPSCDFAPVYPAPFGPPSSAEEAEAALAEWHRARLSIYSSDSETWDKIDVVAFETLGLLCEVRAVRRAMHALEREGVQPKSWWISSTFPGPDGILPDPSVPRDLAMEKLASAVLKDRPGLATPTGIGINCTPSRLLAPLAKRVREAVEGLSLAVSQWIVLYPNGGHFDTDKNAWSSNNRQLWTSHLVEACSSLLHNTSDDKATFSRIVLGGCCNVSADDIDALAGAIAAAGFINRPSGSMANL